MELTSPQVYDLAFRVHKSGEDDYIIRSRGNYCMRRSVTAEIDLEEAGEYSVLVKITAIRDHSSLPVEAVIRENCKNRRDKLLRIGLAYDLAHAKGQLEETAGEKLLREKAEARLKAKELTETKAKMVEEKKKAKKALKKKAKREKKAAEKAAMKQAKRESKAAKKMAGEHANCEECKAGAPATQDNAAAAADIARPGEPDNMKNRNSEDYEPCKVEEPKEPAEEEKTQENNDNDEYNEDSNDSEHRPEIDRSGSYTSNQDTSATRIQEDPAANDIAGELSKNVSFGDPMSNRMPCGFPESARHSTCDTGGSDNATNNKSQSPDSSRRPSQQNEDAYNGNTSITASPGADADAQPLPSPVILDFASPNFRQAHPERMIISDAPDPTPAPQPLPQPLPQLEKDDSDTDSDVSSICSSAAEEVLAKSKAPPPPEPPKTEEQKKKEEEEEDEFEKDPWNAVCVVGLRVYAKALVKTEINGETHWHRDSGCACDDKAEEDVAVHMELEELKEEIEKEVWTPTTDDENKQQLSPEHTSDCHYENKDDEIENREEQKRKRRVTIKREVQPVEVTIRVVRPHSWEDGEASLDVDDSAMDATKGDGVDGKGKRQGSIMGIRGRLGSVIVKT